MEGHLTTILDKFLLPTLSSDSLVMDHMIKCCAVVGGSYGGEVRRGVEGGDGGKGG